MELDDASKDSVHPEVRAHVNSLVSALGGPSADDDGRYRLGDDALGVLRDLKQWLRFYDEKMNRMDVARCMAEANLVEGDLLPILATWTENETDNPHRARIALACFELLVPLTWPLDRDVERMTVNHHRHIPVLELAQVAYKRAIINYDGAQVLHTAVRVALSSMAVGIRSRSARDHGIIKLALFFLRNMAMIAPAPGVAYDGDESQISRSATMDAFAYQDIFLLLLTIASNTGEDFKTEDVTVMEIIFHLVKRIDVEKLFMAEQQLNKHKDKELIAMMAKEAQMKQGYKKSSGRHNRFGAMVWIKRDGHKMSTVSGADALLDSATRQRKMDSSKQYRPPRRAHKKEVPDVTALGTAVSLNARANNQLRAFVEEFIDSGFNPLFQHIRKTLDDEAPHLLHYHRRQFFYLVAWFLQAERLRRKQRKPAAAGGDEEDVSSFNLVAGVLNQHMFVTLSRAMHQSLEGKEWQDLTAVMRCFTEILLTVQEMRECGQEDDEEIAENILARLFYEDATHDCVATIVRSYKDQGFDYLDAATELAHHFLRILEAYSKQNVDMQVRSRKAKRKKKRKATAVAAATIDGEEGGLEDLGDDESDMDATHAERTTVERKFDFGRFAARFCVQGAVDTFLAFVKFYRDLSDEQLKRAHRYFYRLCFKQDLCVMMFRVDIIHLLHGMVKGPEPIDKGSNVYRDWEELARQILKRCVRKIQERPQLVVELLFSKINSTVFFLEKGFDKPASTTASRPAAELEFKHATEKEQQIAIVVGTMLDRNQADLLGWAKEMLGKAERERRAWEESNAAIAAIEGGGDATAADVPEPDPFVVRPSEDVWRTAMFKNAHLRLLLKLCDVTRLAPTLDETPDSAWVIASPIKADTLRESIDTIGRAEFSPPTFEEGELAEDQLRRKTAPRKRVAYDDDDDDLRDMIDDDGILFPAGGPTTRKVIDDDRPKKTRRRRRKDPDEEGAELGDSDEEARRDKRRAREREKALKIKSAMYVTADDDEDDDEYDREFYAREEEIRRRAQRMAGDADVAGMAAGEEGVGRSSLGARKRKAAQALDAILAGKTVGGDVEMQDAELVSDDDDEDVDEDEEVGDEEDGESDENRDDEAPDTSVPAPSPKRRRRGGARKRRRLWGGSASGAEDGDGDITMQEEGGYDDKDVEEDEDEIPTAQPRRARTRGGFIVDSDDE